MDSFAMRAGGKNIALRAWEKAIRMLLTCRWDCSWLLVPQ